MNIRLPSAIVPSILGSALAAACALLSLTGTAQSQDGKMIPQGSIGSVRTIVSIAVSHKTKTNKVSSMPATLVRIKAEDAAELIQGRTPSIGGKWSRLVKSALNTKGSMATIVRSRGGQYLAVSWTRAFAQKARVRGVGALIDLNKANGGLSSDSKVQIGIAKGSLGPLCTGCNWVWGTPDCTPCGDGMPQPISTDFQQLRSLPVGREVNTQLFVLPRQMLGSGHCIDEKTLAMLTSGRTSQ